MFQGNCIGKYAFQSKKKKFNIWAGVAHYLNKKKVKKKD